MYKKDLEVVAIAKLNNLQSNIVQCDQLQDKNITLDDIKAVIELLLFSSHDCISDMNEIEIKDFFDSHGNFLQKGTHHSLTSGSNEFNPSANLYQYFELYKDEIFGSVWIDDGYGNLELNLGKLNPFEIIIFQNNAFYRLMNDLFDKGRIELMEYLKKQKNDYPRLLRISRKLFPDETKKILNAYLDYLFDKDYKNNIELENKNGELILKLNILTEINASAKCNPYDRKQAIYSFFYGGLIMGALGSFHNRCPRTPIYEPITPMILKYLSERPSGYDGGRHISTTMRWFDTRTTRFETRKGYRGRETVEEYCKRHEALAHDWNNKKFGEFSIKIKSRSVIFRWKYIKNFFLLDDFDEIRCSDQIIDMLCLYEGYKYDFIYDFLTNKSL